MLITFDTRFGDRLQTHQWSENTIKTVVRPRWQVHGGYVERTMQMIVTPRVRAEVQAHFNCPELEGAELEDQGEDGTALTHWEKRVFEVRERTRNSLIWFPALARIHARNYNTPDENLYILRLALTQTRLVNFVNFDL